MSTGNQAGQVDFLYKAISDVQSTIRAIDTKIGALLVILVIPLTKLGKIYAHCGNAWAHSSYSGEWLVGLVIGLFVISWIGSFVAAIRTLMAIDNPVNHVDIADDTENNLRPVRGTFYGGHLFKFGFFRSVFTKGGKSEKTLQKHLNDLPKGEDGIRDELAFEHMKLCFIRHIKFKRQDFAFRLAITWMLLGGIIWIFSLSR